MVTALPLCLSPSHLLGARVPTAPVSPRSPTLSPRRAVVTSAYYSAPTAELPTVFTPPPLSLYDVLGVDAEATSQDIKAAYRGLARSCHPDVAGASAAEFMRIHAAYSTLSDPDMRADYNRKLTMVNRNRRPGTYSAASPSFGGGYSGRSWETDQCW